MPKPRKRKQANLLEQAMGVRGATGSFATDVFTNAAARTGWGTPSLGQGSEYTLVRFSYDYWQLITLFRNHWISRRIVEVPAQDMIKAWPKLTSEIEPKDLTRIDRAIRKTNTKNNTLTGLTWGRLFGGAGGLIIVDGQENELDQPLDLDSIKIGAYKGILPFDRWSGISPIGDVCTDVSRPLDFNKPETYEVRISGGESFKVHSSRLLRFLGPTVPTPELEAQSYWGISVLEPIYESITRLDNMYLNILNLSFRANLIGMKFPELSQLLSGLGSSQLASRKFEQRMEAVNHLMSNQSLIPLPADGGIEQTQYAFSGVSDVLQLFQLDISGAAQIPITRLFGRTYNGLGQAGDGDERIYEEKISTDQSVYLLPQLEKLYPVVCMSELGEVPDDLDLTCPSIRVLDEKEKAELAKSVADTTTVYLNGGIMSPRRVAMEVKQSSDITGIGTNLDDEYIAKLSDDVQSEGEMGEGLFGEGEPGLSASESPAKVVKEENKEGEKTEQDEPKGGEGKKKLAESASKAADVAPAYDTLPTDLKAGETVIVHGKLLTVDKVLPNGKDLFDQPYVPVLFRTGEVVAYRPQQEVKAKVGDTGYKSLTEKQKGFYDGYDAGFEAKARATDEDGPATKHEGMELYHGLPVRIETKQGQTRSGTTPDGKPWKQNMPADYGFVEGVEGADGDSLDAYVGPSPESSNVYVVDQYQIGSKDFDEHKCLFGYHTQESAVEDYMAGHHLSSEVFAGVTPFTMPMFRKWMREHDMTQPCSSDVAQATDEAEFKESLHPRKADGKFGKGGASAAAPPLPKGMEHVTKAHHKTATSLAEELLSSKKYSDKEVAQACNSVFGTSFKQSNINFVKNKMWLTTSEGKAATAAKKAAIAANAAEITKASKAPMEQKKLDAVLTEAEKKTYKTMYVSAKDSSGKATYFKVSGVPEGLDNNDSMVSAMKKKGLSVVNSGPFSADKPAPAAGYTDFELPADDVKELKAAAYEKAQAEAKQHKVVTESEELGADIQTSIKHYTNGSYGDLNRKLRSGQPMSAAQATLAANLDAAIRKSKIMEDTTVYRGVAKPAEFFGSDVTIGTVIVDNGFISTSKNTATANGFSSGGLVAKIRLPKGSSAMDVSPLSLHSKEKEVLLPRGSMFKIVGVSGKTVEIEYVSGG